VTILGRHALSEEEIKRFVASRRKGRKPKGAK
jgi:hypothetical protein